MKSKEPFWDSNTHPITGWKVTRKNLDPSYLREQYAIRKEASNVYE